MDKVLIVDDEPRILKFLALKLQSSGFQVATAGNGTEAIETTRRDCPDIVVMDIIMPGLDGVEALRQIRKISSAPVILFSARDHDAEEIKALGADDYIRKPFDPDELVRRIRALLNHPGPQAAA